MSKFTYDERNLVKSIVASLTIKRIPEPEIIKAIFDQTNKTLSKSGLFLFEVTNKTITLRYLSKLRKQIKRESFKWYKTMREGEYEYIHEFKERMNEILFLQKMHHEIIDSNPKNPQIQQTSLADLHFRLTLQLKIDKY